MVKVESYPGTLEQNQVLDIVDALIGQSPTIHRDRWTPDWEAVETMVAPLDSQRLWSPLHQRDSQYHDNLPFLQTSVHRTGREGGLTLMLNGHVDVVPATNQDWTVPAFSPRVQEGRMYGRGTMDMKAGLLAASLAFRYMSERWDGQGTLLLAAVPEEESGGNGTMAALQRGYVPDGAVFAEPTDLAVVHRHVGIQAFGVEVLGRPGGMLRRSWGLSAAPALARVAVALEDLEAQRTRDEMRRGGYDDDDLPGFVNFIMTAGDWMATRASHGRLTGLMSVLPGESQEDAEAALRKAVAEATRDDDIPVSVDVWVGAHRGGDLSPDDFLVRSFAVDDAGNDAPGRRSTAGALVTDAKIMQGGGWAPSVVLGPIGGNHHSADEWVDLESIERTVELLVRGSVRYFGSSGQK
jgi:acetylornithine deacetylase